MRVRAPILVLLGLFLCGLIFRYVEQRSERRFHEAGDRIRIAAVPIIGALESYKSAKGTYPEALDSLVPGVS